MGNTNNNNCETCAQTCFDAKQKVPQLEKKLYILTIVMTIALTLAGQELIKTVADYLSGINDVVEKSNQLQDNITPAPVDGSVKALNDRPSAVSVVYPPAEASHTPAEFVKDSKPSDEYSGLTDSKLKNTYVSRSEYLVKIASGKSSEVYPSLSFTSAPGTVFADNHSMMLTPSLLPFDVYGTTLGLGINYGFGGYYGIDAGWAYIPPSIPEPTTMALFSLYPLVGSRRR